MSSAELLAKLDELCRLPGETEWVEFKRAESNFDADKLGQYVSALSNEANLKGQPSGWLVFGVDDSTHQVVGTRYKPTRPALDALKLDVALNTSGRLTFDEIHELHTAGGRVLMFQVPPAVTGLPTAWKGHWYGRDGESLGPLSIRELELIRGQAQAFEPAVARPGVTAEDVVGLLDVEAYFRLTKQRLPDSRAGVVDRLTVEQLVTPAGDGRFDITNLAAVLFARNLADFGRLGRKAVRVIKYRGNGRMATEREWTDSPARSGYAAGFEAVMAYINSQLPQNEHIGQALRTQVRTYPDIALREVVPNALIHQDFSVSGAGPTVEIFDDRLEVTNPGESLIEPDRVIDAPPRSRNEALASFMRRMDICEERGSGWDKIIGQVELYQLPPPVFRLVAGSTRAVLYAPRPFARMNTDERVRACYQHCVLCWVCDRPMTNTTLRQRLAITDDNYSMASRVIRDALDAKQIKLLDPHTNQRYWKYIPYWA